MKENKSLIWKYFLQQKAKEIIKGISLFFLLGILLGAFFLLLLGVIYSINWIANSFPIFTTFLCYLILAIFLTLIIYVFGSSIGCWIKSNWREAKRRAKKDGR